MPHCDVCLLPVGKIKTVFVFLYHHLHHSHQHYHHTYWLKKRKSHLTSFSLQCLLLWQALFKIEMTILIGSDAIHTNLTSSLFPISFPLFQQEQILLQNTYSCLSNNTNKSINCVRMWRKKQQPYKSKETIESISAKTHFLSADFFNVR